MLGLSTGQKVFGVMVIVAIIAFVYIILTATMPVITSLVDTVNSTVSASSNVSNYPGFIEGLNVMPLAIYSLPTLIGGAAIAMLLKRG